jgi:uncharacterized protein YceK
MMPGFSMVLAALIGLSLSLLDSGCSTITNRIQPKRVKPWRTCLT